MSSRQVRWGFRIASCPSHGLGHMARCRVLAKALDTPVRLFMDPDASVGAGWPSAEVTFETRHNGLERTAKATQREQINALLLDGYMFDHGEVASISKEIFVAAICDAEARPPVDRVLRPGFARQNLLKQDDVGGPAYSLIQQKFVCAGDDLSRWRILVSMGAYDSRNATGLALDALSQIDVREREDVEIVVALPPSAPHFREVVERSVALGAKILRPTEDLADISRSALFAVGAPGVSLLERAACGTPTLTILQNAEQEPIAAAAAEAGVSAPLGSVDDFDVIAAAERILALLSEPKRLDEMRRICRETIDGGGAVRAASWLRAEEAAVAGQKEAR